MTKRIVRRDKYENDVIVSYYERSHPPAVFSKTPVSQTPFLFSRMKWLRSDGGPVFYGYSNRTPVTGDVQMITTCLVFGTIFTAFLIVFPGVRKQVSTARERYGNKTTKFRDRRSISNGYRNSPSSASNNTRSCQYSLRRRVSFVKFCPANGNRNAISVRRVRFSGRFV